MSQDPIDELFGGGEGQPSPRFGRILLFLIGGLILTLFGMTCSAVPGGLVVLLAWVTNEKELDRVESGYLAEDYRIPLTRLQRGVTLGVVLVIILFFLQLYLLYHGFYDLLWGAALQWLTQGMAS